MSDRAPVADAFLADTDWAGAGATRTALAGDASARRYFRLRRADGAAAVLMDAPPDQGQDIGPFMSVGAHLHQLGLSPPTVLQAGSATGFLLLEDLGDAVFARLIASDASQEAPLYAAAVDVLVALQAAAPATGLNRFTPESLADQVSPVFDWYVAGITGADGQSGKPRLIVHLETVLRQHLHDRTVMILRDYHAENLIWLPTRAGVARVGLLDFQDALLGDPAYDLVSLLLDARRDVSPDLATDMIARFVAATGCDADRFSAAFAVSGAQRNLRILGVFARLCLQHGKPHYIDMIPRVWGHVMTCLAHPALTPVASMFVETLPPPTPENLNTLRTRCATAPLP